VLRDITERKQAYAALRTSEESLRATLEHTPYVGVQWFDAQGRMIFWNQASETIYGWTAAEAMGKTLGQLILAPAEQAVFEKALKQIELDGKPVGPMEFPFQHRSGSRGVVLSTIFRIPAPNDELRFVCMDVDISERKRAEAERERAVAGEQQARAEYTLQLIQSQEAERKRIAGELHDSLGQNLLLIKNRAQLALVQAGRTPDLRELLEGISHLASQSIAEARQISHDLHPYQLDHLGLTCALEAMIDSAAGSSGIVFQHKLDNVDGLFPKDATTNLYRIVQESLNNILKHSRARQARIRLERDLHEVQLHIEDDGCGFKTGGPVNGGRGLGLKNIAERVRILGGKLKIDSQPGQGTRLEVTIPTADAE
jgi:PAS domain S-box-containing protein